MSVPLIPPVNNSDGYPARLFVVDTGGVFLAAGAAFVLQYNETRSEWYLLLGVEEVTITTSGGFYVLQENGATISTGPADSGSPVGSYTGSGTFTVQSAPPSPGALEAEVTLSPGAPGTLIPEV
jgi:hypothetical protein